MMSRILSNIIINGLQSIPEDKDPIITGTISVNGHGKALLSITDNGKGIPDSIRDKVFVPKFSTKSKGSGIGLAIAKHGIEHTGGKIWFETETDIGTTFYIELPMQT